MTDEEFERMLAGLPVKNEDADPISRAAANVRQPTASSVSSPAFKVIPDQEKDSFFNKAGRFARGFGAGYAGKGDEYLESLKNQRQQKDMKLLQATALDARNIQTAIQNEDFPKAIDVLVDRMSLLEKMGEDTSDTKMLRDALVRGRPDIVMGELNTFLSSLPKQTIDPKMLTDQGQMVTQRLGGDPTARTVAGFTPEAEESYRPMSSEELVSYRLPPDAPYRFNMKTNKPEYMGGATSTTNIRTPASIPTGYRAIYDDQGNITQLEAIAGGPAASDEAEILAEAEAESRRQGLRASRQSKIGGIVIEDINRYRDLVENQGVFTPVTGALGEIVGNIAGTPAADARSLANTIGANIQFEALDQMRKESKTGGALGSITQNELKDLRDTLGSIAASQSDEQLLYNLNRLENLYNNVMAEAMSYPEEERQKYGITITSSQSADPLGLF